jgi:hypothetical protein
MVWLICLAVLLGGAMAGWGSFARSSAGNQVDLLADWCASPATLQASSQAGATPDPTSPSQNDGHALHKQVHCDLCVVAADLPSPPPLHVPLHLPAESAGWRPSSETPHHGLLPWQRPQPRGPPRRA